MTDFLYQKTVYQGYLISDLIDEVASYRVHKNDLEARVTDLLAQLEQREQEVADLTAIRAQLREKNTQLAVELSQAKQPVKWHPASEQPERWPVLVKNLEQCYHTYYHGLPCGAVRWCYIDEVK